MKEVKSLPVFENGAPLRLYQCDFLSDGWKDTMHSHENIEIAIVLRGAGIHKIDKAVYQVKAGEVYIINTDSKHYFSPSDTENTQGLSIFYIGFYPEVLYGSGLEPDILGDIRNMLLYKSFFENEDKCAVDIMLKDDELKEFYALFRDMQQELEQKKKGYQDVLKLDLSKLLIKLCRYFSEDNRRQFPLNDYKVSLIKKVIDYFNENYPENLTLDSLSDYVSLSKRHLTRVFRENTGLSILEYLQKIRIDKACYLLVTTNKKVTEIAAMVGYTDYRYFSVVFRKYMGMTAKEYVKQQKGKLR